MKLKLLLFSNVNARYIAVRDQVFFDSIEQGHEFIGSVPTSYLLFYTFIQLAELLHCSSRAKRRTSSLLRTEQVCIFFQCRIHILY